MQGISIKYTEKLYWCPKCKMKTITKHKEHGGVLYNAKKKKTRKNRFYSPKRLYMRKNGREVVIKLT